MSGGATVEGGSEALSPARPSRFDRWYGARPWHLVALLLCFAVAAYSATRVAGTPPFLRIAVWFVGAAVVWDLVVGPALAGLDRLLRAPRLAVRGVPVLNHLRAPGLISLLLLAMFWPSIRQRSEGVVQAKAGLSQEPYLGRWLAVVAVLFAVSAVVYAVRVLRAPRG